MGSYSNVKARLMLKHFWPFFALLLKSISFNFRDPNVYSVRSSIKTFIKSVEDITKSGCPSGLSCYMGSYSNVKASLMPKHFHTFVALLMKSINLNIREPNVNII